MGRRSLGRILDPVDRTPSGLQGLEPSCSCRTLDGRTYSGADRLDRTIDRGKPLQLRMARFISRCGISNMVVFTLDRSGIHVRRSRKFGRIRSRFRSDFALESKSTGRWGKLWESPWGGPTRLAYRVQRHLHRDLGEFDLRPGGVDLVFRTTRMRLPGGKRYGKTFARHGFTSLPHGGGPKDEQVLGELAYRGRTCGMDTRPGRFATSVSRSYRQPLNFTFDSMKASAKALSKLRSSPEI